MVSCPGRAPGHVPGSEDPGPRSPSARTCPRKAILRYATSRRSRISFRSRKRSRCTRPGHEASGIRHTFSGGMSIQRRSFQLLQPGLGELHALGAFHQRPLERRAVVEMADEHLPFRLEAVVVDWRCPGTSAQVSKNLIGLRHVGIPHRPRRVHARLAPAFLQAGHRRAERAVDVEGDEIVAAHARAPGAVDVRDRRRRRAGTWHRRRRRRRPCTACRFRPSASGYGSRRGRRRSSPRRTDCRARSANGRAYRG